MGGRALKKTETKRISRSEFDEFSKALIYDIEKRYDRAITPLFYRNKETFGDIDIIVDLGFENKSLIREFIEETFKPNEIFHNDSAWSFDYKMAQVDLIFVDSEDYDSNYHYLAYNDLGNFIGRLAQSIGFKYGQEGLWYNHYSDDNTKTKIIVSKDYANIFEFLGLEYSVWLEGFDTLEEIFAYVTTSWLFNPEMFQLNQLNKINRERNLKRASYMSFLDYIKDKKANPRYNREEVKNVKENVIEIIKTEFPEANITLHLAEINYEKAKKDLAHAKFNGNLIKEKYGLEGKELGEAIIRFKDYFNTIHSSYMSRDKNFESLIIDSNIDYIYESFEQANNII